MQKNNNNKVIILDWDDTLFPTTVFLKQRQLVELGTLSEQILNVLQCCVALFGKNTFIVTNAKGTWIAESLQLMIKYCSSQKIKCCFDEILKLVLNDCITTISARDAYRNELPTAKTFWKYFVFEDIVNSITEANVLISVGDSEAEYEAAGMLKQCNSLMNRVHRLRLIRKPTIAILKKQFTFMLELIRFLNAYYDVEDVELHLYID